MLIIAIYLLFFYALGISFLPSSFLKRDGGFTRVALGVPLLGISIWIAITVTLGLFFPYNRTFLLIYIVLALGIIGVRRKNLIFPRSADFWIITTVFYLFACFVSYYSYPLEDSGALVFNQASYDYTRSAIINSIATYGFPPRNPWLADSGNPEILVYYFGWYGWAAQLQILSGISSIATESLLAGFSSMAVLMAIVSISFVCWRDKQRPIWPFLVFILIFSGCLYNQDSFHLLDPILPDSTAGFWPINCNLFISPHHSFAAGAILLFSIILRGLLKTEDQKERLYLGTMLALVSAAIVLTSVYAGLFALLIFTASVLVSMLSKTKYRKMLKGTLPPSIVIITFSFILLYDYFFCYLIGYPSEQFPLGVGLATGYNGWTLLSYLINICFVYFPIRMGFVYILGMAVILVPRLRKDIKLMEANIIFVPVCFVAILFVHSTYYSNDFAWRLITTSTYLLAIFAAVFLAKVYFNYIRSSSWIKRIVGSVTLILVMLSPISMIGNSTTGIQRIYGERKISETVMKCRPAWETVRNITSTKDMVLSNPDGGISSAGVKWFGRYTTNVFFSFFADRPSPIADSIFSKCYSEYYDQVVLEKTFNKVKRMFNGSPADDDADYIADKLKVKSVIVTNMDKLWDRRDFLLSRYDIVSENDYYRVYLLRP